MNIVIKKAFIPILSFIIFTNIYLITRINRIIDNKTFYVSRYKDFEREQSHYKNNGNIIPKKKRSKNMGINLASKIRLDSVTTLSERETKTTANVPKLFIHDDVSPSPATTKRVDVITGVKFNEINRSILVTEKVRTNVTLKIENSFKKNTNVPVTSNSYWTSHGTEKNKKTPSDRPVANFYVYGDLQGKICEKGSYDTYALHWNPLFPLLPLSAGMMKSLEDEKWLIDTNRRITGFISPITEGFYEFELACLQFCDFILIENFQGLERNKSITDFAQRITISIESTKGSKLTPNTLHVYFSPKPVYLQKGKKYLFDITSLMNGYGMLVLKWRMQNSKSFTTIPTENLEPLYPNASLHPILPNIRYFEERPVSKLLRENSKNDFWKLPVLSEQLNVNICKNYHPSVPVPPKDDNVIFYYPNDLLYPIDMNIVAKEGKGWRRFFITSEKANEIVEKYVQNLNGNFVVNKMIHIENSPTNPSRYFVEIDVKKRNSSIIYRTSNFVNVDENNTLCRPPGVDIKLHEKIYLLTPVKNQRRWIEYFIKQLNELVKKTGEANIHLIVVDYQSTDGDVESIIKSATFEYTFIKQYGDFNKVKGLNLAVNSIKDVDPILFVFDLQLQFPLFIFDYVRKHTIKNQMAYVPIMMRCACGQHPEFTNLTNFWNLWQDIGFGMISIYKSDWMRIGGMDEIKYGKKWGGEDWDFARRVLRNKIEIIHHRLPGYYHLFHDTKGSWDGTKEF